MSKPTDTKAAAANPIPAVGLFGRRCVEPAKIGEPARALFGRRSAEAA